MYLFSRFDTTRIYISLFKINVNDHRNSPCPDLADDLADDLPDLGVALSCFPLILGEAGRLGAGLD